MAARGTKPTAGPKRFTGQAMTEWTDVENVPFEDAPELPPRAPQEVLMDNERLMVAREWPKEALRKWRAWSRMPHCKLWGETDWEFAFDCLEVAAKFLETSGVGLATELRNREKLLGTTAEYRRDLRIRYVEPEQKAKLTVVRDDFNDL